MEEITVYSLNEVASILKVTKRSVYTYIKEGRLPAVKLGKYWRVSKQDLEKFLEPTNIK